MVQDVVIRKQAISFQLACLVEADGETIQAQLPKEYKTGYFGPTLVAFCLHQYHRYHATQPLLLEAFREHGIDISAGQLNIIPVENKGAYHLEKEGLLQAGLQKSLHISSDDIRARHFLPK